MKIKTLVLFSFLWTSCSQQVTKIDLSGSWQFTTDSTRWDNTIRLPGSMTSNGLGEDITVSTMWTGGIVDSAYFRSDAYARYRESGYIKVPFWLQPVKYYKGVAWYKKGDHCSGRLGATGHSLVSGALSLGNSFVGR